MNKKLAAYLSTLFSHIGDWSNGMIGVSKTFGGSSILSSPVLLIAGSLDFTGFPAFFISWDFKPSQLPSQTGIVPVIRLKRYDLLDLLFIFSDCFIAEIVVTSCTGNIRVSHLGCYESVRELAAIY